MRPSSIALCALIATAALVAPSLALKADAPLASAGREPAGSTGEVWKGPGLSSAEVRFNLEHCAYAEQLVKVPVSAVAGLVPPDFVVRTAADGTGTVNLGVATCARGSTDTETGPAAFGWLLVRILRPADPTLAGGDLGFYFYRLEHYTLPDDLYAHVAAASGSEHIDVDRLVASVDPLQTSLAIEGAGLSHHAIAPAAPYVVLPLDPPEPLRWREFHRVAGGYATLEASLAGDPSGNTVPGAVQAEGGLAAQVLGPANGGLFNYGGSFGVLDGRMMVLPAPS